MLMRLKQFQCFVSVLFRICGLRTCLSIYQRHRNCGSNGGARSRNAETEGAKLESIISPPQ